MGLAIVLMWKLPFVADVPATGLAFDSALLQFESSFRAGLAKNLTKS